LALQLALRLAEMLALPLALRLAEMLALPLAMALAMAPILEAEEATEKHHS
jgi:hypothetical protein